MIYYQCNRCMKKFEGPSNERLACPDCHCQVYPLTGKAPLVVSRKRLLVIHENRLYTEKPRPDPRLRRRNSLSNTLDVYQTQVLPFPTNQGVGMQLGRLRTNFPSGKDDTIHDVSSMDVYPLILAELAGVLSQAGLDFVLYGSGALWLEGNPRPQKRVQIKDLDMCIPCSPSNVKTMSAAIMQLVSTTTAARNIVFDEKHVYITKGNTIEFISPHETLQFSFNLQNPTEFEKTIRMARAVEVFGTRGTRILVAGMDFITYRLFGDDALIATRLFRADKTRQTLMYGAMAIGFRKCTARQVATEILNRSIRLEPRKLVGLLRAVGKNAYDDEPTEFHGAVEGIIARFEQRLKSVQNTFAPLNTQYVTGRKRLMATMSRFAGRDSQVINPILAERWKDFMDFDQVTRQRQNSEAAAVRALRDEALTFLLVCLDDVDDKLLEAQWLSFDHFCRIKQGKLALARALEEEAENDLR